MVVRWQFGGASMTAKGGKCVFEPSRPPARPLTGEAVVILVGRRGERQHRLRLAQVARGLRVVRHASRRGRGPSVGVVVAGGGAVGGRRDGPRKYVALVVHYGLGARVEVPLLREASRWSRAGGETRGPSSLVGGRAGAGDGRHPRIRGRYGKDKERPSDPTFGLGADGRSGTSLTGGGVESPSTTSVSIAISPCSAAEAPRGRWMRNDMAMITKLRAVRAGGRAGERRSEEGRGEGDVDVKACMRRRCCPPRCPPAVRVSNHRAGRQAE